MWRRGLGEAVTGLHGGCRAAAWRTSQGVCTLLEQCAEQTALACRQNENNEWCALNASVFPSPAGVPAPSLEPQLTTANTFGSQRRPHQYSSLPTSLAQRSASLQRQGSCTTCVEHSSWTSEQPCEGQPATPLKPTACKAGVCANLVGQGRSFTLAGGATWASQVTTPRLSRCAAAVGRDPWQPTISASCPQLVTPYCTAPHTAQTRALHGMVSVMTAAEAARDLLSAVTQPVTYSELAAHLARDYSMELFDALSGLVLCHIDELSGTELSNLLWAYATVGHHDSRLATTVMQSLSGKLSELQPSHLANALWAMFKMGLYDSQLVTAASEQVWEGLPQATPRQLAAITQCYAWFRQLDHELEDDEDLLRGITARFRAQLGAANASEVALMLAGMAKLRWADGPLLDEACAALRATVAGTELPVLAEAVWACALLQHRDLPFLEAVADRATEAARHAAGLLPTASTPAAASPSREGSLPSRPRTDARGIANTVAAAASVNAYRTRVERSAASRQEHGPLPPGTSRHDRAGPSQQQQQEKPQKPPPVSGRKPGPACNAEDSMAGQPSQSQQRLRHGPGFSALWPTEMGPGGRIHGCPLYERFNPSLPDGWRSRIASSTSREALASSATRGAAGAATSASTASITEAPTATSVHGIGGRIAHQASGGLASAPPAAATDALDTDVVSKLLWSFGALHCYSGALFTLLFRQLSRLQEDSISWSALARLLGAQVKALELQPGPGPCRINPLESESANAWVRFLRTRPPLHVLPERLVAPAFVAFYAGEASSDGDTATAAQGASASMLGTAQLRPSGLALSRAALAAEVAAALRDLGLDLRCSATVDGVFSLPYTAFINGLTVCVEVLSVGCCTLEPPHRPLGPAVARLRSLEFRGWKPLVIPFDEWAALSVEEHPHAVALQVGGDGEAKRARALQEAAGARRRYLQRKLEELLGEELPPLPQKATRRRMC